MFIQTEATPNPEVLKFLPGKAVLGEGTRDFRSPEEAAASALAAELFEITGVNRVFYGPDFITVGKHESVDWPLLKAPILAAIMDHFTSGQPLFADAGDSEAGGHDEGVYEGETAQIVAEIKDLAGHAHPPGRGAGRRRHPVQPLRCRDRRGVAEHARRVLGLPVLLGDLEGRGGEHAQALRPGSDCGRAGPLSSSANRLPEDR